MSFHSLLATFPIFCFFNIWSFSKSLLCMKQIQASLRVKISECVHAWFEFLYVALLVIFNFFQIDYVCYFTSLHDFQDVENHYCFHLRDIEWKTGRKILYLRFLMHYFPYNWIGEHEITKLKKKMFASNPENRQAQKAMN